MKSDILIVGGGPAGLSAAYSAAKNGAEVILLEKSKEIGYPIHSSGGSWIAELKKLQVPENLYHPIKIVSFITRRKKAVFKFETPVSCIIDIRGLYQYLAEKASLAGAKIIVNAKVNDTILTNNGIVQGVKASRADEMLEVYGNVIIDASGFAQTIARKIGFTKGFKRFGVGAEYDLFAPDWDQDEAMLIMGSTVAPSGYGWIFPLGKGRVRVGIGVIRPITNVDPRIYLDILIHNTSDISEKLKHSSQIEYHYGVVPSEGLLESTVSNGVIIVGDAAGHVSALVGEGIRFAIEIGKYAGIVASEAIQSKDYSKKFLQKYEKIWKRKHEKNLKIGYEINRHISLYSDEKWDEKIELISKLNPEQFSKFLKADFSVGLFLSILGNNPFILGKATFRLAKKILTKG